ncbi:scaffold protein Nfu/NifU N terminal-domain-containing protein [Kickxella alabastrina]|uniref:scaffold protein Nfu/NifU N terminal-domain-containing protein n=1 Tax=Kickxella alabastrina TaxID=61397 RepID=UPI002220A667|nr:scaffold protein Nfu/NifU N terminal-domain-containing protein [Kickxella alabastrina]KAI7825475.1 scaffold protein Nfu/NifU N terminal-domain-containing protein [Kickxella alabastrina]
MLSRLFTTTAVAAALRTSTRPTQQPLRRHISSRLLTPRLDITSVSAQTMARRTMFIQTATTPNEDALQFIPGVPVLPEGAKHTIEFSSPREGLKSPLATRLFAIEGVKGIMFGSDFVTVRKDPDFPWQLMKPDVYAAIMDHFSDAEKTSDSMDVAEHDSEIVAEIKELLESRVRPAIQEDGGDLDFVSFNEGSGIVKIRLRGACKGCSSSSVTLKHGVEGMLSYYILRSLLEAQANKEFQKLEASLQEKYNTS